MPNRSKFGKTKLKPVYYAIIRKLVAGKPVKKVAEEVGVTPRAITYLLQHHEEFKAEYDRYCKEIEKRFFKLQTKRLEEEDISQCISHARESVKRLAVDAVNVLADCLFSDNNYVKISAAKEILDRAGIVMEKGPQMEVHIHATQGLINAIDTLKKEAKESISQITENEQTDS